MLRKQYNEIIDQKLINLKNKNNKAELLNKEYVVQMVDVKAGVIAVVQARTVISLS